MNPISITGDTLVATVSPTRKGKYWTINSHGTDSVSLRIIIFFDIVFIYNLIFNFDPIDSNEIL